MQAEKARNCDRFPLALEESDLLDDPQAAISTARPTVAITSNGGLLRHTVIPVVRRRA
jgi:hypothetical protein